MCFLLGLKTDMSNHSRPDRTPPVITCCSIHGNVARMPSREGYIALQLGDSMRELLKLRDCTPTGPSTCWMLISLPATCDGGDELIYSDVLGVTDVHRTLESRACQGHDAIYLLRTRWLANLPAPVTKALLAI